MLVQFSTYLLLTVSFFWIFVLSANATKPTSQPVIKKFVPKKNSCSLNTLCTNTTMYPVKAIKNLFKRNKKRFEYLSGSVIEPIKMTNVDYRAPDEDENMCRTRKVSKIPLTAFDVKSRLKYIVNIEDFQQIITYETCVDTEKNCFGNESNPNDFLTFCKQAYTMVRLLSISHRGKLEYSYFPVPSNCVCSYKKLNIYDYT